MQIEAFISEVTFSDNTRISLAKNDIVVFVGPNNSGKSAALKGLLGMFQTHTFKSVVIASIKRRSFGSSDALLAWLKSTSYVYDNIGNPVFAVANQNTNADRAVGTLPGC